MRFCNEESLGYRDAYTHARTHTYTRTSFSLTLIPGAVDAAALYTTLLDSIGARDHLGLMMDLAVSRYRGGDWPLLQRRDILARPLQTVIYLRTIQSTVY